MPAGSRSEVAAPTNGPLRLRVTIARICEWLAWAALTFSLIFLLLWWAGAARDPHGGVFILLLSAFLFPFAPTLAIVARAMRRGWRGAWLYLLLPLVVGVLWCLLAVYFLGVPSALG